MMCLTRSSILLFALASSWGCAHAGESRRLEERTRQAPASQPISSPAPSAREPPSPTPSTPAPEAAPNRLAQLRGLVEEELQAPELAATRLSLLVVPLHPEQGPASQPAGAAPASQPASAPAVAVSPLLEVAPDARRLPASNAKLLTTLAAASLLPGRYRFVTEVSHAAPRGPVYLWGTGDPILRGRDLERLASAARARGLRQVRGIVVDDLHFGRQRLAPGFEAFSEGSYYRPTSGALNVDGNAIVIRVSAPPDRRRPRVDVTPPSDYVAVRKLVRFGKAKRGAEAHKAQIQVRMQPRGSLIWLTVSGTMGRKAPAFVTRRAVPDPSLNAGWALRRALVRAGVEVTGGVRRGRRPKAAQLLARREHSLSEVLAATNQHSDNLAAETLVRVMSFLPDFAPASAPAAASRSRRRAAARPTHGESPGSWQGGLRQLRHALSALGLSQFETRNGSGLHRHSWVTARTLVQLLEVIHSRSSLRKMLLPTLAVAGKSGTLAPRLRDGAAAGHLFAKTGTLGGALALSGFVDPGGEQPLAFSLLVNGRSDRAVRDRMDRIAELVARYARGLPLVTAASMPAEPSGDNENTTSEDDASTEPPPLGED